jgi:hypothetical protein
MQNRSSKLSTSIEPLHLALALCDWIGRRAAELEAPEVLAYASRGRKPYEQTEFSSSDSRNGPRSAAIQSLGITLFAMAIANGCTQSELPVYPVVGHVTFENEWPLGTSVVLHPLSNVPSIRPQGVVDALGNFRVTTFRDGDGAPPGEYIVTLVWHKFVIDGEDYKPGPNVLPPMYAEPATSPLIIEVTERSNNLKPFTLSRCDSEAASLTSFP